jgi:hypothetical protein
MRTIQLIHQASNDIYGARQSEAPSVEYLLAELRCAALRVRLWQSDIDAVGLALKAGLISPDQAVEHLADCGVLRLLGLREEQEAAA